MTQLNGLNYDAVVLHLSHMWDSHYYCHIMCSNFRIF